MKNINRMTRVAAIERRFGVTRTRLIDDLEERATQLAGDLQIAPGEIILVEGASGSGKSILMRAIADRLGRRASIASDLVVPDAPVIDALPWLEIEDALDVLGRFGLGEVFCYLSPARML